MIYIKTNKEIGEYLEKSKVDNTPIRVVSSLNELKQYKEGVDYTILRIGSLEDNNETDKLFNDLKKVMVDYVDFIDDEEIATLKIEIEHHIKQYKYYIKQQNESEEY